MHDHLHSALETGSLRSNDNSSIRDAASQAYMPMEQSLLRIDIRSSQSADRALPTLQISFDQGISNSQATAGGSRDDCTHRSEQPSPSAYFSPANPWQHSGSRDHRRHHHYHDHDQDQATAGESTDAANAATVDATNTSTLPDHAHESTDNQTVNDQTPEHSSNHSTRSQRFEQLIRQLCELFRQGDVSNSLDGSSEPREYTAAPSTVINIDFGQFFDRLFGGNNTNDAPRTIPIDGNTDQIPVVGRVPADLPRLPSPRDLLTSLPAPPRLPSPRDLLTSLPADLPRLPSPSDLLASLPADLPRLPSPSDLLASLPAPPGLPSPSDLLASLPAPPGLPSPSDLLASLPAPPGLPSPSDLLASLPAPPGLPSPSDLLHRLPNPFRGLFG